MAIPFFGRDEAIIEYQKQFVKFINDCDKLCCAEANTISLGAARLVRRVAPALLAGVAFAVIAAMLKS